MRQRTRAIIILITVLISLVVAWLVFFSNIERETIQSYISSFGILGPIVLSLLIIVATIFPFYNTIIYLSAGYLYGPVLGFFIVWIAQSLASLIAIFLVKKFGKPLVEKAVRRETIEKYEKLIDKHGLWVLYFVYVLPFLPDDAVTYLIALSNIRLAYFIPIVVIGTIPKASIAFIGDNILNGFIPALFPRIVLLILGLAVFSYLKWLRPRLKSKH